MPASLITDWYCEVSKEPARTLANRALLNPCQVRYYTGSRSTSRKLGLEVEEIAVTLVIQKVVEVKEEVNVDNTTEVQVEVKVGMTTEVQE